MHLTSTKAHPIHPVKAHERESAATKFHQGGATFDLAAEWLLQVDQTVMFLYRKEGGVCTFGEDGTGNPRFHAPKPLKHTE